MLRLEAQAFVAGLFQACLSVNSLHDNLRVYISLRQELYDDIPALYEDAQKYRDLIETIHWTEGSLLTLMANRIRHALPALAASDDQECWSTLFGAPPGQPRARSFGYMIERTLYRPREIIQFCTQVIECADGRAARAALAAPGHHRGRGAVLGGPGPGHRRGVPVPVARAAQRHRRLPRPAAGDRARRPRAALPGPDHPGHPVQRDRRLAGRVHAGPADRDPVAGRPAAGRGGARGGGTASGSAGPGGRSFLGPHQARRLNLAAAQAFQVHPMFRAYLHAGGP